MHISSDTAPWPDVELLKGQRAQKRLSVTFFQPVDAHGRHSDVGAKNSKPGKHKHVDPTFTLLGVPLHEQSSTDVDPALLTISGLGQGVHVVAAAAPVADE